MAINNIDIYLETWLFVEFSLNKWDLLFDEWDTDHNIYIVIDGLLSVETYTTTKKKSTKILSNLKKWDLFWEWSISTSKPKQTLIKAISDSKLIKLNSKNDLESLLEKHPKIAIKLLKNIIDVTNTRLLNVNKEIASIEELNNTINILETINRSSLFVLFDKIHSIITSEYVIYLESHQVLDNYLIARYDTRQQRKLLDIVIEKKWETPKVNEISNSIWIKNNDNILVNKITLGDQILWFLIVGWKKIAYTENEKRILKAISFSLAWVIKQIHVNQEKVDKR